MTEAEILAKLEELRKQREQLLLQTQFNLGAMAGQEKLLTDLLAQVRARPAST